MKQPLIIFACLTLLSSGCALVPSPYSAQLKPVVERYSSIKSGASRAEVEAQMGKPSRQEDDACVWETRFDERNYAIAKVWFDTGDTATKVEITRAHGTSVPGFHAIAVTTRTK